MFSPTFLITNKILTSISKIEAAEEVIKHSPLLPLWEKQFKEDAIIRSAYHGTHIEGNQLRKDDAKDVLQGRDVIGRPRDIQEIINYRKVIDYIDDEAKRKIDKITEPIIKKIHRIITDTSADQGILVGAQDFISIEELRKYTGGPMQKLSVKGDDASRALYRLPAKELKQYLLEMLIHLEAAADNIMGTHSTTRGEKSKNPTLGQDIMAKESDFGRIDGFVRSIEKAADELFNWEVQIMKVKYKKDHYISMLQESDAAVMSKFNNTRIEDGIKITVKQGSTLPTDKLTQRQEAIDLARLRKIDPITFFERLDYPNPRETAKRLVMYDKDPMLLFPELVGEIEKQNKKIAKDMGRTDKKGNIIPPTTAQATDEVPPIVPPVIPNNGTQPVVTPAPTGEAQPTEHTERLFTGEQVLPFDGIAPSLDHVNAELAVMGTPKFPNLDTKVQAIYAKHTLQEKKIIEGQGTQTQ